MSNGFPHAPFVGVHVTNIYSDGTIDTAFFETLEKAFPFFNHHPGEVLVRPVYGEIGRIDGKRVDDYDECDYCGGDVTFDGPCYCDEDEDEEEYE